MVGNRVLERLERGLDLVPYKIVVRGSPGAGSTTVRRHSLALPLGSGPQGRAVFLSGRPPTNPSNRKVDVVTQKFRLRQNGKTVLSALFGPRGRPHGDGHSVLGNGTLAQSITVPTAELFLRVLGVLGDSFAAFFNAVAPSHDWLHCHYWREEIPILGVASLKDWPIKVQIQHGLPLPEAIDSVIAMEEEHRIGEMASDFDFGYHGNSFTVASIPRNPGNSKPIHTLANGDETEYDKHFTTFGVLEMSGCLVGIRTQEGFRRFQNDSTLYEACLKELGSTR